MIERQTVRERERRECEKVCKPYKVNKFVSAVISESSPGSESVKSRYLRRINIRKSPHLSLSTKIKNKRI